MTEMTIATQVGDDTDRRTVLMGLSAAALAGFGLTAGIAAPALAEDAADWPHDAFKQTKIEDAIKALYGKGVEPSDNISLDVPEIAENGAVVPVAVSSSLPDVTSLAILIPENPFTLAASYKFPDGTAPSVACRLKMAKTSKVVE